MKKVIVLFFLLMLCGCTKTHTNDSGKETAENVTTESQNAETTDDEEAETSEIEVSDENLTLMQSVLLGKVDFYDTKYNRNRNIEDLFVYDETRKFYVVDLDGDEVDEVIMHGMADGSIFHENNGVIYRYPTSVRESFNEDGTINGSAGAANNFLCKVKEFTETEMVYEYIYYAIDGKYFSIYEYEGEQIELTEAELAEIKENYSEIKIDSYEFNNNNIVTLLGGE